MRLLTIGFTRHGAKGFFDKLRASGARKIVDVRLNNTSQLSGFAKRDDLSYFLDRVAAWVTRRTRCWLRRRSC